MIKIFCNRNDDLRKGTKNKYNWHGWSFLTLSHGSQEAYMYICTLSSWFVKTKSKSFLIPTRTTNITGKRMDTVLNSWTQKLSSICRLYSYTVRKFSSVEHKFPVTVPKCCVALHKYTHNSLWMLSDENIVMHNKIFGPWILIREFFSSLNLWWY